MTLSYVHIYIVHSAPTYNRNTVQLRDYEHGLRWILFSYGLVQVYSIHIHQGCFISSGAIKR